MEKVQIRTNFNVSEKWGMWTTKDKNRSELFSCVTANKDFCSNLASLKQALNTDSFKEVANKVESCANSLGLISKASEALSKYTNSAAYEKTSKEELENLYELRKNTDIGLKMKFSAIAPEDKETFSIGSRENKINQGSLTSVFRLSSKIKEASLACASYEDANRVISEHLNSHSSEKGGAGEGKRKVTQ